MFAAAAAILTLIGVIVTHVDSDTFMFWLGLGLAAFFAHFAFDVALPVRRR